MQAKTDKIEISLVVLTVGAAVFHLKENRLGTQVMLFLGASVVLYYIMRGVLYGRAFSRNKAFAGSGFGLFAYIAFIAIFILSLLLAIPGIEGRMPLLLYAIPIPVAALAYLISKHERSDWLPFVGRLVVGGLALLIINSIVSPIST